MLTEKLLTKLIHADTYDLSIVTNDELNGYREWYQKLCIFMNVPLDRKYTQKLDKQIETKKITYSKSHPIDYSYYLAMYDLGYRSVYDQTFKEL